jgi:hypothetical protein
MEELIKKTTLNLFLAITIFYIIISISIVIGNVIKKRILRHKGNIYIAIQLLLNSDDTFSKNKIADMDLEEIDAEVDLIINGDYISSSLSSKILKSKLNYINQYYIVALKNNLFEKRKKQFNY